MTSESTIAPITTADHSIPMTAAQRGIFYAQQIDPDVPMSVAAFAEFHDDVDAATMQRSVDATSAETESALLRLVRNGDDEPRVVVDHARSVPMGHIDFADADDPRTTALAWIDAHRSKTTDLFADPLLETYLLRLGPRHVIWYCWGHHLAFDGYAAMYMMVRVAAHYTAISAGTDVDPAQTASMADIAEFDRDYRSSDDFTADRAHWAGRLEAGGAPETTSLSSQSAQAAPVATIRTADLPDDLVERIRGLARAHRVRPASVITAAVSAYLARLNDRSDSMLSLPVAARDRDLLRTSAGLTSNVLPIRTGFDEDTTTVAEFLRDTNTEIKEAVRHQKYRHEDITADILASPGGRRGFFGPMVNVMLFFEHIDFGSLRGELNVLSTGPVEDASVNVYDGFTGGMRLDLEANPNVYAPWEIDTHHARIVDFLTRFVQADPGRLIVDLDLLTAHEAAELPSVSCGAAVDLGDTTLVDLLEATTRNHPDGAAVTDAQTGRSLTHRELVEHANAAAAALRDRGVGPESIVGVRLTRSLEQVIALHSVIRAGAAFLPIDPIEPADRLGHILTTAQPALVISDDDLPVGDAATVTLAELLEEHATGTPSAPRPDQAAYVLFTSGSTGKPKGVVITHRAIVNRLRWMQSRYTLTPSDRVLQKTPATFDVSVWEFFWSFTTGAELVVPTADGHRDPWYLRDIIDAHRITTLHFVPSMLAAFTAALDSEPTTATLSSLRQVFTSGEALTPATVAACGRLTSAPVHNLYGPTEAAIDVTFHDACSAELDAVPIGAPVWNTGVHVLDHRLSPQPPGAIGELYLSGVQLARGYRSRPDLTAARFVADPRGTGERFYRTGDLVRRRADGELEYLGRSDSQVKIRGQRVELGEIESALSRLENIAGAGVVLRDDVVADAPVVVGYVAGTALYDRDLRAELADHLPEHMIPTIVVVLDTLPTTSNGKLDRRALPVPEREDDTAIVEPRTAAEHLVATTVADVLGSAHVSMSANFFDIGGNSLSATRVAARLSRATGTKVGIRAIFDAADLAGLSTRIDDTHIVDAQVDGRRILRQVPVEHDTESVGPVPLSPAQHRLWLTARLDPSAAATYNIPFTVRLVGNLDTPALQQALTDVVGRHEPLRSLVEERSGVAYIAPVDPESVHLDLPILANDDASSERDFASMAFDLTSQLPIRARLLRASADDHRLTIVIHHIAADGWSLGPLAADLATAYRARRDGAEPDWAPLAMSYSQFSAHAQANDARPAGDDPELRFWTDTLAGCPAETELPLDHSRSQASSAAGATIHTTLPASAHRAAREIAATHDTTMFMVLHAAVVSLLRTMSQTSDIVVGTPVSGRGDADTDGLVGMFVNTLALRTEVDKESSFADLLAHIRETDLNAFENADLPFDRIVDRLNPERSAHLHPFFQVSVALEDNSAIQLDFAGLTATAARVDTGLTKFDLQFTFTEHAGSDGEPTGIGVELGYATALFDQPTMRRLAARLIRTLESVTADPRITVADVPMLDLHERLHLVPAVGVGRRPVEHLSRVLNTAVDAQPGQVAITDGSQSLTYRQLDRAANRLARLLVEHGAGPETYVAVALPRGIDWMVTLWAIARSGAAWVPIDPAYPAPRITHMLDDSGARLLVTDTTSDPGSGLSTLRLDDPSVRAARDGHSAARLRDSELTLPRAVDHPAYLIYTSGTTGTPKGVVVSHRGLADFAAAQVTQFGVTPDSHTMHMASPSFDASVLEVLMAVAASATMHIVPPGVVGGSELAQLMRAERITHAFLTPSILTTMSPGDVPELAALVIGGEHPNPAVVREWSAGPALYNAYGPTETTVVATVSAPISPDYSRLTIGRPIRGIAAMVLDERLRPVMPGAVGELYIAGDHLARGYHGVRPLTSKRFIANPYGDPGERMYRTGDLVRWTSDHELEFRGRADHQTKIRGHRIELGEIDAALAADDAVAAAVTIARDAGGQSYLVSYVTTVDHAADTVGEIRERLADRLPRHMIPTKIVHLDKIPTTPIGKIDLRALPESGSPVGPGDEVAYAAPRSEVERLVAELIAERLGLDPGSVGRDHDFFDLGGNSLLATQIVGVLEHFAGRRVTVRDVFEHSTVAALARLAGGDTMDTGHDLADLHHDPDTEVAPGPAQRQLWFLNQFAESGTERTADRPDDSDAAYAIAFALDLRGDLDVDALTGAIRYVVDRHEPLRTVFPDRDGQPVMEIRAAADLVLDLTPRDIAASEWVSHTQELARRRFDLTREVPLRTWLHRIDADAAHHKLTIVVHHIAADGWSMAPLGRDIAGAYADLRSGRSPAQAPLRVGYRDYLRWQADNLGSPAAESRRADLAGWWRRELDGLDVTPTLVTDVQHSDRARTAEVVEVDFDASLRRRLVALADGRATDFMTVHAVFAALLHRLHGDPDVHLTGATSDIVIGTPVAGRNDPRLSDIVGMFVNSVVLRTPVDGDAGFSALLDDIRHRDLEALSQADMPFEEIVAMVNPPRMQHHPIFQIALAVDASASDATTRRSAPAGTSSTGNDLTLDGIDMSPEEIDTGTARFDLELRMRGDTARFTYATDVFGRDRIVAFADTFVRLAQAVVDYPETPIDDLAILPDPVETAQPSTQPVHLADIFENTVRTHPDRIATDDGVTTMTYAALDAAADVWAARLLALGVGTEDVIAVALDRSVDFVIAVWAVAKTGAAVAPVDTRYPAERVEHIINDSGALLGITTNERFGAVPHGIWWLSTDSLSADTTDVGPGPVVRHPDSVAYVIYTSGSTGKPKGVSVSHRGLAAFAEVQRVRCGVAPGDRTLHFASPAFDASMLEFLLAFSAGATMVIAPATIYGGDELTEFLAEQSVTHAFITPAALAAARPCALPELRALAVGGEASTPELVARWAPGRRYLNCYGPTETTIVTTMSQPLNPGDTITIGAPISDCTALVLDRRLRPLPAHVPGELYLAGPGVARGYLNRRGLTATRFVASTAASGQVMYRTGDIVHRRADGSLIYHGRSDNQVKVRGFRIELDEVSAALSAVDGVDFATTVADGTGADAVLVGYVTLTPEAAEEPHDPAAIRTAVRRELPRHMVPATIVILDTIPLTGNGKLDRRALPSPTPTSEVTPSGRAPRSQTESALVDIFGEVLGRAPADIGATDDFFEIGGTSLQATTAVSRINRHHTGERIRVRDLFDHPTAAALAEWVSFPDGIDPTAGNEYASSPTAERPETVPLAPVQRRLWSMATAAPDSTEYVMPFVIRIRGCLDHDAMRSALVDVVARHTSLRTVYSTSDSTPVARVLDDPAAVIGPLPVESTSSPMGCFARCAGRAFDLTVDAPFRATLLRDVSERAGAGEYLLVLVIHHIAADGASLPVLVGDLVEAYRSRRTGRTDTWEPAGVDYRDYALEMANDTGAQEDLGFWTELLADAPAQTTVAPRVSRTTLGGPGAASSISVPIDDEARSGVLRLAQTHHTTPFSVLHTALAILLNRLGSGTDVVIGTPVANRTAPAGSARDYEQVVGMFVNTLALRTYVDPTRPVSDLLARTRDADLAAIDHRATPFDDVVAALNPGREIGRHPLFQIALSVHDFGSGVSGAHITADDDLSWSMSEIDAPTAKFDLQFTLTGVHADAGEAMIALTYDTARYRHDDARKLVERLLRVLRAIVCDAGRAVGDIRITDPLEVAELAPRTGPQSGTPRTLDALLADAVTRNPRGLAAITDDETITYADLDARSNRLARVLLGRGVAERGAGQPEPVVAMAVERSIDALVAIWAIVKTGAAYVPVDPTYPAERVEHMLTDSGARLMVTTTSTADRMGTGLPTLRLDDRAVQTRIGHSSPAPISDAERASTIHTDQLAYVIYTSGSTGTPKGVLVPHAGLRAVHDELRDRLRPGPTSRVLHFASPSFDASVLEFLLAACGSSTLVIAGTDVYGGTGLSEFIDRHGVTHAFITPAAVASMAPADVPSLRALAVGGEAYGAELVRRWAPGRTLVNVYGPTETTIITTGSQPLTANSELTIGTPNNGVAALVLDARLHPVPAGVTGELYLVGAQVTRGYHRRPDLTSVRYVPAPMVSGPGYAGRRMYRTGDLVRWTDDGRMAYVGRSDTQVQVRGFRIELGEIDDALTAHPSIDFAVTVVDDRGAGATLRSYVTARKAVSAGRPRHRAPEPTPETPEPDELRRHLARTLPRHMVPVSISVLDTIPLTPVGKLDRAALPSANTPTDRRLPRPGLEAAVAEAFADILGIDIASIGADDGFFDLGGNSLMATSVTARLKESVGHDVRAQILFTAPTPAELAALLSDGETGDAFSADALAPVVTLRPGRPDGPPPLYVVHPAIGLSWSFVSLLGHLPADRAVYGLQNPMLSGASAPDSIADIAAFYVERIREIDPHGPHHLLGWSLGGMIAQEMAVQLEQSGDEVGQLILLDSYVIADRPDLHAEPSVAELMAEFDLRANESEDENGDEPTVREVWQAVRAAGGILGGVTQAEFEAVHRAFRHATPLAADWRPRTYHGDATFVSANLDRPPGQPAVDDWRTAIGGSLTELEVHCSHARMLLPDNVTSFVEAIRNPSPRTTKPTTRTSHVRTIDDQEEA